MTPAPVDTVKAAAVLNVSRGMLCDLLQALVERAFAAGDGRLALELDDVRIVAWAANTAVLRANLEPWWRRALQADAALPAVH